ncbi:type II toxin-antitoxin system prevent-host-death family antitoxin [Acidaminobacter sp. JC074]|uniref:type II toxin-antitoxin system Phd/YefM family antitoxin n=1 Tax=Acidaminobacter sp. JC074 TaxID=2530199 RepID=UPI001F0D50B2|nr:type II toxin-antitoxin system prevent-host-death family antitoxin [Acidaminobacter sp. JC074]MCH4888817.1 type II toxin-antitoxin system prevent-host-death family antitoxin [Acidaminobacter sp. JC074]
MSITVTDLKNNLSFYLSKSLEEDIYITKNGKIIAKLSNPMQSRVDKATALFGVISHAKNIDVKAERLE